MPRMFARACGSIWKWMHGWNQNHKSLPMEQLQTFFTKASALEDKSQLTCVSQQWWESRDVKIRTFSKAYLDCILVSRLCSLTSVLAYSKWKVYLGLLGDHLIHQHYLWTCDIAFVQLFLTNCSIMLVQFQTYKCNYQLHFKLLDYIFSNSFWGFFH